MVNDACVIAQKPLVYGAIHKFEGQVSVFNYKNGPTYRCLFPTPPLANSTPSCSEVGVIGILPGIIGAQQANEAIKIILEIGGVLSGKLLIYDSLAPSYYSLKIKKTIDIDSLGIRNKVDFESFNYDFYCGLSTELTGQIEREEFDDLSPDSFVLDVREEWEKPEIKIGNVLNIPLGDLKQLANKIPKDKPVYVVCQKGARSQSAIDFLKENHGFDNLINLKGGIL